MDDRSTNALVRRNGDQRTRNRRSAMAVPSGNADAYRARAEKYYCPGCGQVIRVVSIFMGSNKQSINRQENRVLAHEFYTSTDSLEYCPGGTYDPVADAV